MRTALLPTIAAAGVLAIAMAGCGGGGGGRDRTVTVNAGRAITVTAHEYRFDPNGIVVKSAGSRPARLTLTLRNDGSLAHDLRVERDGRDVGGTSIFTSGEHQTVRLTLPPGSYKFLCTVGDHAELGMKGTLVVR